jgi:predicted nucleic acid-binding Zn ribbon protein
MKILGDIIKETIADLGIQETIKKHQVITEWDQLVGTAIAQVAEPQRISSGRLFVKVKNDAWRNELFYQKKEIINTINAALQGHVVMDIVYI